MVNVTVKSSASPVAATPGTVQPAFWQWIILAAGRLLTPGPGAALSKPDHAEPGSKSQIQVDPTRKIVFKATIKDPYQNTSGLLLDIDSMSLVPFEVVPMWKRDP